MRATLAAVDANADERLRSAIEQLCALCEQAERTGEPGPLPRKAVDRVLRTHPRQGCGFYSRAQLIAGFRALRAQQRVSLSERVFIERLKMRPVRTHSGVAPVTVLSKPFPCPGRCVFCPNDVRMPKSYLSREPGCQRAEQNGFDPYLQTWNRMRALAAMGHAVDKAELIVLGGTWSAYPERYQRWFLKRCFDALNDFGRGEDGRARVGRNGLVAQPSFQDDEHRPVRDYNRTLLLSGRGRADASESASEAELALAQRANEQSGCRNVGLSIETRPDLIDEREVLRLRALGCTKIQLGLQSLSDAVLAANQRGHDLAASRRAMRLLRSAGFKLQAHWMPNLLGSTPALDREDFTRLFEDPDFRPDELKVYPCSLVPGTELITHHARGEFRPYDDAELLAVLEAVLEQTPRYCRLSRVIRDISSQDIVAGNRRANLREVAEAALLARGARVQDIRSREIKHARCEPGALELRITSYETGIGSERFLELVTPDDRLVALLRLCLPSAASFVDELGASAVIRELHVYGGAVALGVRDAERVQHRGHGRALLAAAAELARAHGYRSLAVISAVGTREYYRRQGFTDGALYQHREL